MNKTFPFVILMTTLLAVAAHADVTSYSSPPVKSSATGNSSTGATGSNPNIVTGNHFGNHPYAGQTNDPRFDINSNEPIIDNGYQPTIQLNCTHDDSCPPDSKHK
jgi:hypothetical protein